MPLELEPKGAPGPSNPIFFIHIMKTGGHTVHWWLARMFDEAQRYPDRRGMEPNDIHPAGRDPKLLRSLTDADLDRIRLYTGHLPFYASTLVPRTLTTIALLRHPVDRTLSHLRQIRRLPGRHHGLDIEEIYNDWGIQLSTINNHQTKVFSATEDDGAGTVFDVFDLDEGRLANAIANLRTVDVVGLTEQFDDFRQRLGGALGHEFPAAHAFAASQPEPVDPAFRARIAKDNPYDMALYDAATAIVAEQRRDA